MDFHRTVTRLRDVPARAVVVVEASELGEITPFSTSARKPPLLQPESLNRALHLNHSSCNRSPRSGALHRNHPYCNRSRRFEGDRELLRIRMTRLYVVRFAHAYHCSLSFLVNCPHPPKDHPMKKTVAVVSFRATQDDIDALTTIRERTRSSGSKQFATRADCLRIALAQTLNLLRA